MNFYISNIDPISQANIFLSTPKESKIYKNLRKLHSFIITLRKHPKKVELAYALESTFVYLEKGCSKSIEGIFLHYMKRDILHQNILSHHLSLHRSYEEICNKFTKWIYHNKKYTRLWK